jgi:hypothetical protein
MREGSMSDRKTTEHRKTTELGKLLGADKSARHGLARVHESVIDTLITLDEVVAQIEEDEDDALRYGNDPAYEGMLQTAWTQAHRARRALLVALGALDDAADTDAADTAAADTKAKAKADGMRGRLKVIDGVR